MLWFLAAITSYFFLAICALIDRHLVRGPIPGPKVYAFYVGVLSIFAVFLIPFSFLIPSFSFYIPSFSLFCISSLSGAFFVTALFAFYWALKRFEASRIVPAVGGVLPLITLGLTYLFFNKQIFPNSWQFLSFILLISGSILITFKKGKGGFQKSFPVSIAVAFLFSLCFIFAKTVYLEQPFLSGFIWIKIGAFLTALLFLFFKEVREELFKKRVSFKFKTAKIFSLNLSLASLASILENFAIASAPVALLAFINALQGTQYIFLLLFTVLFSAKFPGILKEEISKKVLIQKLAAILLICLGLVIFTL